MRYQCRLMAVGGVIWCLICLWATDVSSGKSFFVGLNHALTDTRLDHNFTTHEVDDLGVTFGLILPILDRQYFISYRGAVAFHGVTDVIYGSNPRPSDERFYRNLDQYIGSYNGLAVGTRFDLARAVYVEPMFGLGVLVNIIYGNRGEGIAYGSYQTDLTALTMYEFDRMAVGLWLTFGYVPFSGYLDRADFTFLSVGVAVSM